MSLHKTLDWGNISSLIVVEHKDTKQVIIRPMTPSPSRHSCPKQCLAQSTTNILPRNQTCPYLGNDIQWLYHSEREIKICFGPFSHLLSSLSKFSSTAIPFSSVLLFYSLLHLVIQQTRFSYYAWEQGCANEREWGDSVMFVVKSKKEGEWKHAELQTRRPWSLCVNVRTFELKKKWTSSLQLSFFLSRIGGLPTGTADKQKQKKRVKKWRVILFCFKGRT